VPGKPRAGSLRLASRRLCPHLTCFLAGNEPSVTAGFPPEVWLEIDLRMGKGESCPAETAWSVCWCGSRRGGGPDAADTRLLRPRPLDPGP
jgi:hypothetical protein